jgi:hypothetical protein
LHLQLLHNKVTAHLLFVLLTPCISMRGFCLGLCGYFH